MIGLIDWTTLSEEQQLETARQILNDLKKESIFLNQIEFKQLPEFTRTGKRVKSFFCERCKTCWGIDYINLYLCFLYFKRKELGLGEILGQGCFCIVNEISAISLSNEENTTITTTSKKNSNQSTKSPSRKSIVYDREYMEKHCARENEGKNDKDARYAIKRVKRSLTGSERTKGIIDLAVESQLLKGISHPNIIKMRAASSSDILSQDFFIILDRLYSTLEERIDMWIEECPKATYCFGLCRSAPTMNEGKYHLDLIGK